MIRSTSSYVIARARFALRGAPGTLGIFATPSCLMEKVIKKSYHLDAGPPGTQPYSKSGPGYCTTFTKKLDEGLRLQLFRQKPLISSESYI